MAEEMSTPINTISRENMKVLIMNNMLNNSIEFASDDSMETDSPLRKPCSQPIIKKLFHSPMADSPAEPLTRNPERLKQAKKAKKRKQALIPDSSEKLKRAYVQECDGYSPDQRGGMRKRVLISLFQNKEYAMELS